MTTSNTTRIERIITLQRQLRASIASAFVFMIIGCHHPEQATYIPPPQIQSQPQSQSQRTAHKSTPPAPTLQMPDPNSPALATETGMASWYGPSSRATANGEPYTAMEMTAAHRTLPLNTIIRVTNIANGQSAIVRVNDRGPFVRGRVLDLSIAAARATGVYRAGSAKVRIEVIKWPANAYQPGHWCVQIGAFQSQGHAEALKQQLLRTGNPSQVIEFPGDTGYWVRYKPANLDRNNAVNVASNIRTPEGNVEAFLVRLD